MGINKNIDATRSLRDSACVATFLARLKFVLAKNFVPRSRFGFPTKTEVTNCEPDQLLAIFTHFLRSLISVSIAFASNRYDIQGNTCLHRFGRIARL